MTWRILADAPRLFRWSVGAFAAWIVPLVLLLSIEHLPSAAPIFASGFAAYTYLVVHGLLTLIALGLGVLTLVRGPTKHRLIICVPVLILILYAGIIIGGPD
jgi:hypothetical protein